RHENIWDHRSHIKRGAVALRYSIWDNRTGDSYRGDYPEVYAVLWDDGVFEKSFLPYGLEREAR
ncbi:hypothetical protein LCGC14_3101580, partial [marine sediment metagenome]